MRYLQKTVAAWFPPLYNFNPLWRLIVGTPPVTSKPTIDYSIDEQYDDYETNQNLFDSPEAQQEALVQIKRSESFWAFLSCTVLVVGKYNLLV